MYVLLHSRRHKDVCISFSVGRVFANTFMIQRRQSRRLFSLAGMTQS